MIKKNCITIFTSQNFVISVVCTELQEGKISISHNGSIIDNPSDGGPLSAAQDSLNLFFTITFSVELVLNLYAQWFKPFFRDGWKVLDLFIVAMSLIGLAPVNLPVGLILSLRAIRVVRLFGKVKSLRKMMTALSLSLPPLMNAYIIIFVIAGICEFPNSFRVKEWISRHRCVRLRQTKNVLSSRWCGSQIRSWACTCSEATIQSTSARSREPSSPCSSSQERLSACRLRAAVFWSDGPFPPIPRSRGADGLGAAVPGRRVHLRGQCQCFRCCGHVQRTGTAHRDTPTIWRV